MVVVAALARGAARARAAERARAGLSALAPARRSGRSVGVPVPPIVVAASRAAGVAPASAVGLWRAWCLAVPAAPAVGLVVGGPGAALVAGATVFAVPAGWLWSRRGRGDAQYEAAVPALLDDLAAQLRSGASLLQALRAAADRSDSPPALDLAEVVDAVDRGGSPVSALDGWAERQPLPAVSLTVAALVVGTDAGGAHAGAIEGVAASVRERRASAQEATALAGQARASALVMTVVPLAFAAVASSLDPRVAHTLLATPIGLACLVAGLVLDAVAGAWMGHIAGQMP